jgi:hypothetical protein
MTGTGARRALVTGAGEFVGSHHARASELFASLPGGLLPGAGP